MKKQYILLLILFSWCLLQSCHKPEPAVVPPTNRPIPAELKAYWSFKPGSYWIYKDSVSGNIDSVYVTGYQNYTGEGILNYTQTPIAYEYLEVDTHSSLDGYDYDYTINTQAGLIYLQDGNQVFCSKINVDTRDCFVYPIARGSETTQAYGEVGTVDTCIIRNIYPSYNTYFNVVEVDNTFDSFVDYKLSKYFYVENIGLIRYQVPFYNTVRTLVRYHIN